MLLIFTFLINVAEADLGKVGKRTYLRIWKMLLIGHSIYYLNPPMDELCSKFYL
jgi:hypothetical protein